MFMAGEKTLFVAFRGINMMKRLTGQAPVEYASHSTGQA
jgi:hypothetical protein